LSRRSPARSERGKGSSRQRKRRIRRGGRSTLASDLGGTITTKADAVFVLSSPDGDIDLDRNPGHGIYFHDMRYLDRSLLRLNGTPLSVLLSEAWGGRSVFELTNPDIQLRSGTTLPKERVGVRRERVLNGRVVETLELRNYSRHDLHLSVELEFGSSFNDMFTVRGAPPGKRGNLHPPRWQDGALVFRYDGADDRRRSTTIELDPVPDRTEGAQVDYSICLGAGESARIKAEMELRDEGEGNLETRPSATWSPLRFDAVKVTTDNPLFDRVLDRSFDDLRMLLMCEGKKDFFAAGVPWFVALFGRDSLVTSLQTLPYDPRIAANTLRLLAAYQGSREDDETDEQPGKILHELRVGEQVHLREIPQSPYYGSVDATPLFLVLFAEYVRWTADLGLFGELRQNLERAVAWIDDFGDSDGDGFIDYATRSSKGFRNRGWKDSGNSIVNADGSLADQPIALVEVQGYVYCGKLGLAEVARASGEAEWAGRLEADARALRQRFHQAYWLEGQKYFALAIQRHGQKAEAVSSNPGQALWSGIIGPQAAEAVADRLLRDDLFSGWGVRTLGAKEAAYNPVDYQVGAVWPHDTSLIMAGLKRIGRKKESTRVFTALFEAAALFPHYRLPEVFAGFGRDRYPVPVRYPVACNPQAWAAGAIPYMLASALGLEPDALRHRLVINSPALPAWLGEVTIENLGVGKDRVDLRYHRVGEDTLVAVLDRRGQFDVVITD
jgi:glycogen debranching enzyme